LPDARQNDFTFLLGFWQRKFVREQKAMPNEIFKPFSRSAGILPARLRSNLKSVAPEIQIELYAQRF
jgi:hypothetical protein